ncbi:MAG: GAF domain-containing protein [Candidatus Kapabacteria bacterium]|nr:GAF domain-containing protein [Candidatus Kapabacteria bacterium]MDW7996951.1 GAF domain-containing protein [Bacteroidota bacterium]
MHTHSGTTRTYSEIIGELETLWGDEREFFTRAANTAALLFWSLPAVNWVGFYLRDGVELLLGPFQGHPACQRIPIGRGVCGQAAYQGRTLIVPDVGAFPDYIVCDAETRSELVVPLHVNGCLYGVLDLDSPLLGRFTANDAVALGHIVTRLLAGSDMERLHRYYRL